MNESGQRLRELRSALGVTAEAFAQGCGVDRVIVAQLETGKNKATSYAIRALLARGVDVPIEAMAAYLDGEILLPALLSLRGTYESMQWWRTVVKAPPTQPVATVEVVTNETPAAGSKIVRKLGTGQ